MIKDLIKLADVLDAKGLLREADIVDLMVKLSKDSDELGELIDLDQYRESKKDTSESRLSSEEYKKHLAENWAELQRAIDALSEEPDDMNFHIIVLNDGETYADEASIVKVSPEQMERIEGGENVYDVAPPDHQTPGARWTDIWNLVNPEDI